METPLDAGRDQQQICQGLFCPGDSCYDHNGCKVKEDHFFALESARIKGDPPEITIINLHENLSLLIIFHIFQY